MKKISILVITLLVTLLVGCNAEYDIYSTINSPVYNNISPTETEEYTEFIENDFILTTDMAVSTFGADVDTAAYSIIRKKLNQDSLPVKESVRIEEMLNYFTYNLEGPTSEEKIHITKEISDCPWNIDHQLLMLGLKTEDIIFESSVNSNLVFLLDVSGSMDRSDKLPLLKKAMKMLVDQLRPQDRISIVVYAGAAGLVLDGEDGGDKESIIEAIDNLIAGGTTAGGAGIKLAYRVAEEYYIEGGNNRVILATDGDFNVGVRSNSELEDLIVEKRESGVFLSVLGFGEGNIKDDNMELLADKGNGVYYYIDSLLEAKKVFIEELGGTLVTVAKDVKLQIEFNPALIKGYRLIGYENRLLDYDDFNNDEVDSGDLGAGHEVVVLYELIPYDNEEIIESFDFNEVIDLKYDGENYLDEFFTLSIRYKEPESEASELIESIMYQSELTSSPSNNFLFAASVAEFGLLLRDSEYKYNANYNNIILRVTDIADDAYKLEFIDLVRKANSLSD